MSRSQPLHSGNRSEEQRERWIPYHRPFRETGYIPLPVVQRVSDGMLEEMGLVRDVEQVGVSPISQSSGRRVESPLLPTEGELQVDQSFHDRTPSRRSSDYTSVVLPTTLEEIESMEAPVRGATGQNAQKVHTDIQNSPSSSDHRASHADTTNAVVNVESPFKTTATKQSLPPFRKLWTPVYLQRYFIVCFAAVFLLLLVCTLAVYIYARSRSGLATVESRYYYLWTYGPTAVFILLSTFWSQVEYRTLQLLPWKLMSKGFVVAENSVLLDYVSDWNVWALLRSLKKKHFEVSIVITVSLILKLMTVFSTGLFTTATLPLTYNTTFTLINEFGSSNFDPSTIDAGPYIKSRGLRQGDISATPGVIEDHAYESFYHDTDEANLPIYLSQHRYSSEVNVFNADLDCEEAQVVGKNDNFNMSLRVSSCEIDDISISIYWSSFVQAYLGTCDGIKSNVGWDLHQNDLLDNGLDVSSLDWRLWIYMAIPTAGPAGQPVNWVWLGNTTKTQVYNFTALMCTPRYNISRRTIIYTGGSVNSNPLVSMDPSVSSSEFNLANVKASSLLYATYLSVSQTNVQSDTSLQPAGVLLDLNQSVAIGATLNSTSLRDRATVNFKYIAAQVARDNLMQPSSRHVNGVMTAAQNRLLLRDVTVIIVSTLLGTISLLAAIFGIFYAQFEVCSLDPGSIAGFATILSRSLKFKSFLHGSGSASNEMLEKALTDTRYSTTVNQAAFAIAQKRSSDNKSLISLTAHEVQWWRPVSASSWLRTSVLILPILVIIILEVLYQLSNRLNGVFASSANSFVNLLPFYIPALILFGIRTLFELIYFAARIFQPYHNLRIGDACFKNSIMDTQYRHVAIVGVWRALRYRQWAVMTAGVSVLIGPFLPIAVAGLYTTDSVITTRDTHLIQLNNLSLPSLLTDEYGQDRWVGDSVLDYNASYPHWTYQDLSFPSFKLMNEDLSSQGFTNVTDLGDFHLDTNLPAVYASTYCESVPKDSFNISFKSVNSSQNVLNMVITFVGWENTTLKSCKPIFDPGYTNEPGPLGYFNTYVQLQDTSGASSRNCPGFVTVFGRMAAQSHKVDDYMLLNCWPRVEQSQFDVRLALPDYELTVVSSFNRSVNTTVVVQNSYTAVTDLVSVFQTPQWVSSFLVNQNFHDNGTSSLDQMFQSIVHGPDPTEVEDLFNPDVLQQRMNHTIAIIFAQVVNTYARPDWPANVSLSRYPTLTANLTGPNGRRIVQTEVSTRILQAILAAMTICGAISIFLVDTHAILPKNPLSIAAIASLLADSKMLRSSPDGTDSTIPAGAEWFTDKELCELHVFKGRTYAMGWWDSSGMRIDEAESRRGHRFWFQLWKRRTQRPDDHELDEVLQRDIDRNHVKTARSRIETVETASNLTEDLEHQQGVSDVTEIVESVSSTERQPLRRRKYFAIDYEPE